MNDKLIYTIALIYILYYVGNIAYDLFKGRTVTASTGEGFDSYQVESETEVAQNVEPHQYSEDKAKALEEKASELKKKE